MASLPLECRGQMGNQDTYVSNPSAALCNFTDAALSYRTVFLTNTYAWGLNLIFKSEKSQNLFIFCLFCEYKCIDYMATSGGLQGQLL